MPGLYSVFLDLWTFHFSAFSEIMDFWIAFLDFWRL
nr:MAG TPA: hypothetical protein [Caudoviricetes sp.]